MNFLQRQLHYRSYRFGLFAAIVTGVYLLLILVSLAYLWYFQLNPDPDEIGATFEAVPAIMLTSPLSLALLMSLDSIEFGPVLATLVLVVSGLVQASVLYVVLRGRRRGAAGTAAQ